MEKRELIAKVKCSSVNLQIFAHPFKLIKLLSRQLYRILWQQIK